MPYFIVLFDRLEAWVRDTCEDYTPNIISRVAVFFVCIPMFIYIGLFVVGFLNRKLHYVTLSLGLWIADFVIWTASMLIGEVASSAKRCGGRTSFQPAEEAAIVWYVCIFQMIYFAKHEFKQPDIDRRIQAGLELWGLIVIAVMCTLSQYYLELFDWFELCVGAACGIATAAFWMAVAYAVFESDTRKKAVAGWLRAIDEASM